MRASYSIVDLTDGAVHDVVDRYLRTSPFGRWTSESGDDVIREYRRGAWLKSSSGVSLDYGELERMANQFRRMVPAKWSGDALELGQCWDLMQQMWRPGYEGVRQNWRTPDDKGGWSIWPVELIATFRPVPGSVTVNIEFSSIDRYQRARRSRGLVSSFLSLFGLLDEINGNYRRERETQFMDGESVKQAVARCQECVRAEVDSLSDHLKDFYRLETAPTVSAG